MPTLTLFLSWYYLEAPKRLLEGYMAYARALMEIVPIGFLLRTLLSPWKNIADRVPMKGLNIQRISEKLAMSFVARLAGFMVRSVTIVIGMALHIALLIGTTAYLAMWLGAPLLLIAGVQYLLNSIL